MADISCSHLDGLQPVEPSGDGCVECTASGGWWLNLRMCQTCGHVGCCDSSPGKHATAHHHETAHPLVRSYEPGQDWWWCYIDEVGFEVPGAPPAPSHP